MAFSITSLLLFAIFLSVFLITVPLTGALVRLRANYNPKGLQLDPEDGVQPHTGPVITSFFFMLCRVRSLEVWAGLMKGTGTLTCRHYYPAVLSLFSAIFLDASLLRPPNHGIYNTPATKIWDTFVYNIFLMLVSLPKMIITDSSSRPIIIPYQLPYFRPSHSLRVLYLTPGLSAADLKIYLAISLFSTAILCLLEVISTRLAVQRHHESAEFNSVAQEEVGDTEDLPGYSPDEDVIGDGASRIIDKEGWRTRM
ncbi:mitochondrial carrier, partial [Lactarius akahatsu]